MFMIWNVINGALPILQVILHTLQCANDTMGDVTKSWESQNDDFKKECDEGEKLCKPGMKSKEECEVLRQRCGCSLVEHLDKMTEPSFEEKLGGCCSQLSEFEHVARELNMTEVSVKTCHEVIANFSKNISESAECCRGGNPSACPVAMGSDGDFEMTSLQGDMISQFEGFGTAMRLEAWNHHAASHAALFGGIGMIGAAAVMVATMRLRKLSRGSRNLAAAQPRYSMELGMSNEHAGLTAAWSGEEIVPNSRT